LQILTNFIKPQVIASTYRQDTEQLKKRCNLPDSEELTPLPVIPSLIVETVRRSCLSTTLSTYLMNDSGKGIKNFKQEIKFSVTDNFLQPSIQTNFKNFSA
jgi:hypothetical protein